jgi:site-specific DNA-cytosine methylase
MNILSLFDGIGCAKLALNKSDIKYNKYYSSEIDKFAIGVVDYNFDDVIHVGDIREIQNLPVIDLLVGGSPCQDLSSGSHAGQGLAGQQSGLLFEYIRVFKELKPKWFLLENVKPRKPEWKDEIDRLMGCESILINSDIFVPQNRPRYYWTNIPIQTLPLKPEWNFRCWQKNFYKILTKDISPTLCTATGKTVPYKDEELTVQFNENDYEMLQSLPKDYTKYAKIDNKIIELSKSRRFKLIANCWTVDVISHIFDGLK